MNNKLERARKQVTRLLLAASIIYATIGLPLPEAGYTTYHMTIMMLGAILLFPHSVALAYIASATPRNKATLLHIATLSSIPLAILPLATLYIDTTTLELIIPPAILTSAAALVAGSTRKGSARLSLYMVSATYASLTLTIIQILYYNKNIDIITQALTLTLAYPIPLIISVTTHSLPSTFKDQPHKEATLTLLLSIIAAQTLIINKQISTITQILTLTTYIYTTKIYKTYKDYKQYIKEKKTPAQKALDYYLRGHQIIPIYIIYTIIQIINNNVITILHAYTIGIILLHIIIHAPLMLPVILGIKHKRKYNNLPYITLLLATIIWPINTALSLVPLIITILLIILIIR